MNIDEQKVALRASAKAVRARAFETHGSRGDEGIASFGVGFATGDVVGAGTIVSGFLPIRNEIDPRPLMARLKAQGYSTALPVMEGKGKPLIFRAWADGEALEDVVWGIKEPPSSALVVQPDVVLVPLLAFDRRGFRVGYGGGFYDRSIEQLSALKPIVTIGLAFDEQEVDAVPHAGHDEPLDWVLTPSGPLRCVGSSG